MRIDFQQPGFWSAANELVNDALGLDPEIDKVSVRNYRGVGHALIEITQGLSKLFPLKKKIHYFKNMNPLFEAALLPLAREGYQMNALDIGVLQDPEAWVATLAREDLFVLYSVDEPLLGRAYDIAKIEKALTEKSIFRVRVSHAAHFFEKSELSTPMDKNQARIYGLTPDWALGLLGERGRVATLVADQVPIPRSLEKPVDLKAKLSWFRSPFASAQDLIQKFENRRVAGAQPLFHEGAARVFDRAAIYWTDLDGHAVIDRMAQQLKFDLLAPGIENRLETASLSRWGGVRTLDFYKAQGFSAEILRGLVLIDGKLLEAGGAFENDLVKVRESILRDQSGAAE